MEPMKLMDLRQERKITREQLAAAVGVSYVTIANLETGKYKPKIDLAVSIARFFSVPVESIDWGAKPSADDPKEDPAAA